jgi:hypothetical protein
MPLQVTYINFSISVICASRDSVRDLMLGVEETGMLGTGQYVFINIGKYCACAIYPFRQSYDIKVDLNP